jgi:uncharacterized radical SAM superfamily Fe-S cluster-containing enzyme
MTDEKTSSPTMPEGSGGFTYLEKGEKGPAFARRNASKNTWELRVEGRSLALPAELEKKLGLEPNSRLEAVLKNGRVEIQPNIHSLNRLTIEPTSRCNLACRTCIRNTWDEPAGDMGPETFGRLVEGLGRFPHLESVMFGGFGEPTAHPAILDMVRAVKSLGLRAEMTSNATLLDDALIDGLLRERLDTL